jgi:hypothetical protein
MKVKFQIIKSNPVIIEQIIDPNRIPKWGLSVNYVTSKTFYIKLKTA